MSNKNKTNILPLGDVHVGSSNFNHELFDKWLKNAKDYCNHKRRKSKGYVLLNGDLCDVARSTQDAWGSTMTVPEQIDYIVEALEPIADNILYSTMSNHESRMYKEFNMDIGQEIANRLDIPYGIDCFIDVPYNKRGAYKRVFMRHGNRFSKSYLLFMRNFINDMSNIEADIYIIGHSHFLGSQTRVVRTQEGITKKHYVVNGAFLDYIGGYANKAGMDFRLAGYPIISISDNGAFNCTLRWSDEL